MGLEDDRATYEAILVSVRMSVVVIVDVPHQRSVHANVARANIDMTVDFRRQDAAKLAAVYKLTRKGFPYLTRDRFPLDWATAEVVKQYLRNKRRYAVKRGFIPKRADRKRQHEEVAQGSNGRPRTGAGDVPHIDDMDEDEI
ncbi:hypothetical protein DFH06DRAFT_643532 [Mycena polygramma]|nr:hypothetical protein DFH06DRAFT_643532 [Mycena polygramma]